MPHDDIDSDREKMQRVAKTRHFVTISSWQSGGSDTHECSARADLSSDLYAPSLLTCPPSWRVARRCVGRQGPELAAAPSREAVNPLRCDAQSYLVRQTVDGMSFALRLRSVTADAQTRPAITLAAERELAWQRSGSDLAGQIRRRLSEQQSSYPSLSPHSRARLVVARSSSSRACCPRATSIAWW